VNEVALEEGGGGFFPGFCSFSHLIVIPSLVYTRLSLLPEVCGICDQTVHFDILTL